MVDIYFQFERDLEKATLWLRDSIREQINSNLTAEQLAETDMVTSKLYNSVNTVYTASKITYLQQGKDVSNRYISEILRITKKAVEFINDYFAKVDPKWIDAVRRGRFPEYFNMSLRNSKSPESLHNLVFHLNWMYHFLLNKLDFFISNGYQPVKNNINSLDLIKPELQDRFQKVESLISDKTNHWRTGKGKTECAAFVELLFEKKYFVNAGKKRVKISNDFAVARYGLSIQAALGLDRAKVTSRRKKQQYFNACLAKV